MEDQEMRVTYDLRRRYDSTKRQLEQETHAKDKLETQFKTLLKAFTT